MPAHTFRRNVSHEKGLQPIPTNPKDARHAEVPIMIRFYFLSANETDETNFSVFRPPFSQEWKSPFRGDGGSVGSVILFLTPQ